MILREFFTEEYAASQFIYCMKCFEQILDAIETPLQIDSCVELKQAIPALNADLKTFQDIYKSSPSQTLSALLSGIIQKINQLSKFLNNERTAVVFAFQENEISKNIESLCNRLLTLIPSCRLKIQQSVSPQFSGIFNSLFDAIQSCVGILHMDSKAFPTEGQQIESHTLGTQASQGPDTDIHQHNKLY